MSDLPAGTVTLLFTDVEGSTRLLAEYGEGYAALLDTHRRLLREAFSAHAGVEVDTQGDAFFVAFRRAGDAAAAALAGQQALSATPVRVRMGLHTGEPEQRGDGYVGMDVHRGARIAAAGHGGQVVVSETTRRLLDGVDMRDLGVQRLKDVGQVRLFQLGPGEFPPLKTLHATNLPVAANPLVGREEELAEVRGLLVDGGGRAVTLTGPGGIGKTRFALAVAHELVDAFVDGVWFVDLSAVRDHTLVLPTAAHTIGVEGDLVRALDGAQTLLLLDNFEQVVEAAPEVAQLLAACRDVSVLVTSREALRIASEHEYHLAPLPEPPAVELFRQRASAAGGETEIEYDVAAEICDRVDRLPLAIELAAARVRVFDAGTLRDRLGERLPLLVSRARDLPERQRALQATIAWSYELLDPEEQGAFRRLAVFRGGATAEAIEHVAGAGAELVESLVDKSLLRRRRDRFVMLETIREFSKAELEATDEAAAVRQRHAELFLRLAHEGNLNAGDLRPGGQRLDLVIAEQDNLRAALDWSLAGGSPALGLELATSLEQFWVVHDPREGRRWFAALFAAAAEDSLAPELEAHALRAHGSSADIAGFDDEARQLYEGSLARFEQLGDEHGRAVLLHRLGIQAMRRGDLSSARALVEEAHAIHLRDPSSFASVWGRAQTVGMLGAIARDEGDTVAALEQIEESASLGAASGVAWWESGARAELAALSLLEARVDDAEAYARDSLAVAAQFHDFPGRVFGVGLLACVAAERGELERAGRLWGAIEGKQAGAPLGGWRRHLPACELRLQSLADDAFERGRDAGRELSLEDATAFALGSPAS